MLTEAEMTSENPGIQLRNAREERKISLAEVAQATKIRLNYLQAIESGELDRLPSKAHARGFIRAYAGYLKLDAEALLAAFSEETNQESVGVALGKPQIAAPEEKRSERSTSQIAFEELGERLRQQRETLGFSLEEVERLTRIRHHYLLAIESGDLDSLPSPVQGRGMIHNYATFLGLDPDEVLLRYADGLQARLAERKGIQSAQPTIHATPAVRRPFLPRLIPLDYLLGGGLVIALVGFVVWAVLRLISFNTIEEPQATIPSVVDALLASPVNLITVTPTLNDTTSPGTPEVAIEPEQTTNPEGQETLVPETTTPGGVDLSAPVLVNITVLHRAWMRVTVDGVVEFEGRVLPGNTFTFTGDDRIELLTGDGSALQVSFNQTDLGVPGIYGEVVLQVFTPAGLLLPTPTVTPTPTATIATTPTPEATETPQATPAP